MKELIFILTIVFSANCFGQQGKNLLSERLSAKKVLASWTEASLELIGTTFLKTAIILFPRVVLASGAGQ